MGCTPFILYGRDRLIDLTNDNNEDKKKTEIKMIKRELMY